MQKVLLCRCPDFKSTQKEFVGLLERLTKDELLQERHCLKGIFDDSKAALFNPSEVTVVKESVELHFGAVWLWDNIAQLISNQRMGSTSLHPLQLGFMLRHWVFCICAGTHFW